MTVAAPKFGLFSANTSPETSGDHVTATVTLAEELGLESLWAAEHIVIPTAYTTRYPYDRSGRLPDAETLDYRSL